MPFAPHLLLLKADAASEASLKQALRNRGYELTFVEDPTSIANLDSETLEACDACIVPLRLYSGASGVSGCLNIKSDPRAHELPIVALSSSNDHAIMSSFYSAGADMVIYPPFDPDIIFMQISALVRSGRTLRSRGGRDSASLSSFVIGTLDTVSDGLIVTDAHLKIIYVNARASLLLNLDQRELAPAEAELSALLGNLVSNSPRGEFPVQLGRSGLKATLTPSEGRAFSSGGFNAVLRTNELRDAAGDLAGYVFSLVDLRGLHQLERVLAACDRDRALMLLLAACSMKLLKTTHLGAPGAPLKLVEGVIQEDPNRCSVNALLTALFELLDLVIAPETHIKVNVLNDVEVKIRRSDLLRILGLLILQAVDFAGQNGNTHVSLEKALDNSSATIAIEARTATTERKLPDDPLGFLLKRGELLIGATPQQSEHNSTAVRYAQRIAASYSGTIVIQRHTLSELRMALTLPA